MTKVLFIYEREMPLIKLLREKYGELSQCDVDFLPVLKVKEQDIDEHDIIILIRPSDPLSLKIAKMQRSRGHSSSFIQMMI